MGKRFYLIRILEDNVVWKRHLGQIIKALDFYDEPKQESGTIKKGIEVTQENVMKDVVTFPVEDTEITESSKEIEDNIVVRQEEIRQDENGEVDNMVHRCINRPGPRRIIKKPVKLDL